MRKQNKKHISEYGCATDGIIKHLKLKNSSSQSHFFIVYILIKVLLSKFNRRVGNNPFTALESLVNIPHKKQISVLHFRL